VPISLENDLDVAIKAGVKTFQLMQYFNLHTHHFTDQEPVVELVNQYPWEFDERIKHTR
jgi:hypothetical protein